MESFRYSSQKQLFLIDSLGFTGFKEFIIDNDLNIIDKLLYNVNKFNKNDEKINLINLKDSEYKYDRIKIKSVLSKLVDTAKDLFHLLSEFSKYHNVKEMTFMLLMICYRKLLQTRVVFSNFTFTKTYLIHWKIVKSLNMKS